MILVVPSSSVPYAVSLRDHLFHDVSQRAFVFYHFFIIRRDYFQDKRQLHGYPPPVMLGKGFRVKTVLLSHTNKARTLFLSVHNSKHRFTKRIA